MRQDLQDRPLAIGKNRLNANVRENDLFYDQTEFETGQIPITAGTELMAQNLFSRLP